jgi:DNA polymerase III subunit alpha
MLSSDLILWLEANRLHHIAETSHLFSIGEKWFFVVDGEDGVIVDNQFALMLGQQDRDRLNSINGEIDYFAFKFGTKWYYTQSDENIELTELRYIGQEKDIVETFPFLGVHGGFELMNGSRDYKDWCKKAKFAGVDTLGICEENTLAGVLEFQNTCQKQGIKSTIGETVVVQDVDGNKYSIKLFVQNQIGWKNLLMINACINVHNEERYIREDQLIAYTEGLTCIFTPEVKLKDKFAIYDIMFPSLYYQFDVVRWDATQRDDDWLQQLQSYLTQYSKKLKPIIFSDAYYLEKEHAPLKKELNSIGNISFKNQSSDQFFKTPTQQLQQLIDLFQEHDEQRSIDFIYEAIENTKAVADYDFQIETGKLRLPSYIMTSEEKEKYVDKDDLLWALLQEGLDRKGLTDDKYFERIETEMKVICEAELQDYFLITWDLLNWAHKNEIETGYGRGSVGGSLVAYLLEIVHINPLEYGLLWERFLNRARLYKQKKEEALIIELSDGREVVLPIEYQSQLNVGDKWELDEAVEKSKFTK